MPFLSEEYILHSVTDSLFFSTKVGGLLPFNMLSIILLPIAHFVLITFQDFLSGEEIKWEHCRFLKYSLLSTQHLWHSSLYSRVSSKADVSKSLWSEWICQKMWGNMRHVLFPSYVPFRCDHAFWKWNIQTAKMVVIKFLQSSRWKNVQSHVAFFF